METKAAFKDRHTVVRVEAEVFNDFKGYALAFSLDVTARTPCKPVVLQER
jgi:hypothetical protein